MPKSGFKAAVKLVKAVNKEIEKAEREAIKKQRQQDMRNKREARELERKKNLAIKLINVSRKEKLKAEIAEEKAVYEDRCKERKYLREQIINEEFK